ncbi:MAG: YkgJ family cysteine cluster protein [Dehalococcoidia bacterium]|nr:YkgJ family cysteine cluster protein [Dehalococcoidia bacterium]
MVSQLGQFQSPDRMPCLRCGVCCAKWQPLLDEEEVAMVARGLGIPLDVFYRDHTERYPVKANAYVFRRTGKACRYLRYQNVIAACAIHPFRPEACRNWTPDLSRRECREGLRLPAQLGISEAELPRWYELLAAPDQGILGMGKT